jgi:hypothetical protein
MLARGIVDDLAAKQRPFLHQSLHRFLPNALSAYCVGNALKVQRLSAFEDGPMVSWQGKPQLSAPLKVPCRQIGRKDEKTAGLN